MQSGCLIYLARIGSLACGVQNPFSLLALAIRSRFSFLLGHALAALALAIRGGCARLWRARAGRGKLPRAPFPAEIHGLYEPPSPSLCSSPPLHTPLPLSTVVEVSSVAGASVAFRGVRLRSPGVDLRPGGAAPSVGGLRRGGLLPSSSSPARRCFCSWILRLLCFVVQICSFLPTTFRFEQHLHPSDSPEVKSVFPPTFSVYF